MMQKQKKIKKLKRKVENGETRKFEKTNGSQYCGEIERIPIVREAT